MALTSNLTVDSPTRAMRPHRYPAAAVAAGRARDRFAEWLDPDLNEKSGLKDLLASLPDPTLTPGNPGAGVSSIGNSGPTLIEPAE